MSDSSADTHGHDHPKHELSNYAKRIYAIRDLLLEKKVLTEKDIQSQIEYQEARSRPWTFFGYRLWYGGAKFSDSRTLSKSHDVHDPSAVLQRELQTAR